MAALPLGSRFPDLKRKCSVLNIYKQKNCFTEATQDTNYKKYISHIISNHVFPFKKYKFLNGRKHKNIYKISTVAAYASELDLATANETNNFEYDDNEWDIGIGNLIIDLDADIEKTRDEKLNLGIGMAATPSSSSSNHQIQNTENLNSSCSDNISYSSSSQITTTLSSSAASCSTNTQSPNLNNIVSTANNSIQISTNSNKTNLNSNISGIGHCSKMAVEHSATVDKGLKMKIKRTKSGTKSSEAKHEIVKSNEINGSLSNQDEHTVVSSSSISNSFSTVTTSSCAHNAVETQCSSSNKLKSHSSSSVSSGSNPSTFVTSKRTSSSHRRDKGRDKHEKLQNNHTSQPNRLEVNGPTKQVAQDHVSSITLVSSNTPIVSAQNTASSNPTSENSQTITTNTFITTNPSSDVPNSSTSVINAVNNVNPSIAHTSTSQQQCQGSILCSKSTVFPATQRSTTPNNISHCSPTYSSNALSSVGSIISAEEINCTTSTGNLNSTDDGDPLDSTTHSPPAKKLKSILETDTKETLDVCVGTSIGTITEPDYLGPCEPGTAVTLEGIVWHETEGGVLVVNITWRGKTYVGTLLDCTRHDWAPPRFCDSPTSDLDARTPKGRVKRGRAAANMVTCNDLSNFTETRSSVHSKLRNNGTKGRRGVHGSPATSPSAAAFIPPRADSATKRKTRCPEDDDKSKKKVPPPTPPSTSPPMSPVLLECPEPNCSKKYKHVNGLKYHQSHAHGSLCDDDTKEIINSMSENDESNIEAPSPVTPVKSPSDKAENSSNRLVISPTNLLDSLSTESSLAIHVSLPGVDTSPCILSDKSIVKPAILRFGNEDVPTSINSMSPSLQTIAIQPQMKTAITNSESPNFLPTHTITPNNTPPINSNSSQQFSTSHLIISSQLQHQVDNPLFQSDKSSHIQQSSAEHVLAIDHSSLSVNQSIQEQIDKNLLVHSQNRSSNSHNVQNQLLSNSVGVVGSQQSVQHLSTQVPSQASTVKQTISSNAIPLQNIQTHLQSFTNIGLHTKISQFKVKPTAALMPEQDRNKDLKISKTSHFRKKSRKSPVSSPRESPLETVIIESGRDDVQSPAYSDISDDATPGDEADTCDKILKQHSNKDIKSSPQSHLASHFSMYPYYAQPSYLMQSIQDKSAHESKLKEVTTKSDLKTMNIVPVPALTSLQNMHSEKDKKESTSLHQTQTHYFTNYNAYVSTGYAFQTQSANSQTLTQLPEPEFLDQKDKIKLDLQLQNSKEKHNENHQILKESIEIKSQMNPFQVYHTSQNQRPSPTAGIVSDDRRYFIYSGEQRHKEESQKPIMSQKPPPPSPKHQSKQDRSQEISKSEEPKIKQEGVKPTMETQGPPPPPTSQYAYIHPGYIPSHHYGSISYDPGHPGIYRNLTPMIVPGTYTSSPYLHQLPRYHAPEDLSRSPGGKALDILQHHANQYYSAHKIHELQERALKSPTPKSTTVSPSPLSTIQPISIRSPNGQSNNASGSCSVSQSQPTNNKQQSQNISQQQQQQQSACGETNSNSSNKDTRSPPPQRHVHTHHHTHVGLGYPILPGQYPAPYGAAVLATQQAAAVAATVISPFPPK